MRSYLTIVIAVVIVLAAAMWDTEQTYEAAMEDYGDEQVTLAQAHARTLVRLGDARAMLDDTSSLERPGRKLFFVVKKGEDLLRGTAGDVRSPVIGAAIASGAEEIRLARDDAEHLGLNPHRAVAAFAHTTMTNGSEWTTVVASSVARARERVARARWRAVIAALIPSGLIVGFGVAAMRRQRRELLLTRELELTEAQRRATMGTLAIGIAHEISTPLGAIIGRAEQLSSRLREDEKGARAAQVIVDQAQHITQVVRGMLDLAHGGSPEMFSEDSQLILKKAAALVEHRLSRAGVRLDVGGMSAVVRANVQLLEHAIVNLLLNACDASQAGSTIAASTRVDDGFVDFVISDAGKGISKEEAQRVVEPFYTTKPMGRGTGLGLAIANEIVKSHRGTLTLQPIPAGGTEARIRIPRSPT